MDTLHERMLIASHRITHTILSLHTGLIDNRIGKVDLVDELADLGAAISDWARTKKD